MIDVGLIQTNDGLDIEFTGGQVTMDNTIRTATLLSLFGGAETGEWWGNQGFTRVEQIESETVRTIRALPATSGNLRKIEAAALRDLAWLKNEGQADRIEVSATIPSRGRVSLTVSIDGVAQNSTTFEWGAVA